MPTSGSTRRARRSPIRCCGPRLLRTGEVVAERYVGGRLRLTRRAPTSRGSRELISQYGDVDERTWYDNGADGTRGRRGIRSRAPLDQRHRRARQLSRRSARTKSRASRTPLSNSPGLLGTFRLETPLVTRLATVAVDWQYVSDRLTDRDSTADALRPHAPDLALHAAPAARRLRSPPRSTTCSTLEYAHPVGAEFRQDMIWQDGRTFAVRATFGF